MSRVFVLYKLGSAALLAWCGSNHNYIHARKLSCQHTLQATRISILITKWISHIPVIFNHIIQQNIIILFEFLFK